MRIYVVTRGSYSDYHIEAIYTDRDAAEALRLHLEGPEESSSNDVSIEEWETDTREIPSTGAYVALINEGGNVRGLWWEPTTEIGPPTEDIRSFTAIDPVLYRGTGKTKEHARRSAEELRRQQVALHGFRTPAIVAAVQERVSARMKLMGGDNLYQFPGSENRPKSELQAEFLARHRPPA